MTTCINDDLHQLEHDGAATSDEGQLLHDELQQLEHEGAVKDDDEQLTSAARCDDRAKSGGTSTSFAIAAMQALRHEHVSRMTWAKMATEDNVPLLVEITSLK